MPGAAPEDFVQVSRSLQTLTRPDRQPCHDRHNCGAIVGVETRAMTEEQNLTALADLSAQCRLLWCQRPLAASHDVRLYLSGVRMGRRFLRFRLDARESAVVGRRRVMRGTEGCDCRGGLRNASNGGY
jgi:hypothetical protein